ncbi:hypothetical protein NC652_014906 [Populus alba x Populus x berolinensis]|nr:hypothetical protein NC652_014906 [Populus alba x Populus x berolinensis]
MTIFFSRLHRLVHEVCSCLLFLKDVYDLISIKQGRYALLGGKNMQKQYGRGCLFWWDKKEACGIGEEKEVPGR